MLSPGWTHACIQLCTDRQKKPKHIVPLATSIGYIEAQNDAIYKNYTDYMTQSKYYTQHTKIL